jgi:hypothetical protein
VVLACKITTEYTENTERTLKKTETNDHTALIQAEPVPGRIAETETDN